MPQLSQSLGLDLADALAGDGKALSHFFEGVLAAVFEAEAIAIALKSFFQYSDF